MSENKTWKICDVSDDTSPDYVHSDAEFTDFGDFVIELATRLRDDWYIAEAREWKRCYAVLIVAPEELRHYKEENKLESKKSPMDITAEINYSAGYLKALLDVVHVIEKYNDPTINTIKTKMISEIIDLKDNVS